MKFNAVNNKEHGLLLSVSSQCGGTSEISLACISSMCLVQRFHGGHSLRLAFGLQESPIGFFNPVVFGIPPRKLPIPNLVTISLLNPESRARNKGNPGSRKNLLTTLDCAFFPHPFPPLLFPLINQGDRCLVPLAKGLMAGRRWFTSHGA